MNPWKQNRDPFFSSKSHIRRMCLAAVDFLVARLSWRCLHGLLTGNRTIYRWLDFKLSKNVLLCFSLLGNLQVDNNQFFCRGTLTRWVGSFISYGTPNLFSDRKVPNFLYLIELNNRSKYKTIDALKRFG